MIKTQKIGLDIGRGFVKVYTEWNGVAYKDMFKSVIALGRNELEWTDYKDPIFISSKIGDETFKNYFAGELAQKEGYAPIRNSMDSKTTDTVKKLFAAALSRIPLSDKVDIMLGVPNREWNKKNLNEVIKTYKNKIIEITDNITNKIKKVYINDISIFKESDAALLYQITYYKPNNNNDNVMINVGFRTSEISYYDNNLNYIDKKSKSLELGQQTVLEYVQKTHNKRTLEEIDSSERYNDIKKEAYNNLSENLEQITESFLVHLDEINLYACGGVINNLNLKNKFKKVQDPQMITAKGLFLVAEKNF